MSSWTLDPPRVALHPAAALTQIRKAAEAICKDLLDETCPRAKSSGSKPLRTLEDMQSELRQRKEIIPADIDRYLKSIQSFGNLGSHDQDIDLKKIDERMAQSVMLNFESLVDWYKGRSPSAQGFPGA